MLIMKTNITENSRLKAEFFNRPVFLLSVQVRMGLKGVPGRKEGPRPIIGNFTMGIA